MRCTVDGNEGGDEVCSIPVGAPASRTRVQRSVRCERGWTRGAQERTRRDWWEP